MTGWNRVIMDSNSIARALTRIAHEILERNRGAAGIVLVGIRTGGVFLARRLQNNIGAIEGKEPPMGILDITLYRDDLLKRNQKPRLGKTEIPYSLDDKKVVLVDDVLYTGRTIRAAMDALIDFGRPCLIQLAVLIDRGHREFPIRPDFVGMNIQSTKGEKVMVHLVEKNDRDEVVVESLA